MPLFARAMALKHGDDAPHVLVSVDTIGLPGSIVRDLTQRIERQHGVPRERIVVACTHTHCGPDLVSELSNIFFVDLTPAEIAAGQRYRQQLCEAIVAAVAQSLQSLAPAQLAYGSGQIGFAANRRVLKDGRWAGFGVQPDGPVDHSVPVLRVCDAAGKVRGVVFNYACHCTTMEGNYYRINADWAGYAAADLEAGHPGAVALSTIGCGADANPEPRGSRELGELHGRRLAGEVKRVLAGDMTPINAPIQAAFAYAGLSFELPTIEELVQRAKDPTVQIRRHAEYFQKVYARDDRLPATYPVPIQSWRFGNQLTMIFLGGEVVVDYALRLKRELPGERLWVTAYANDVLGYIASERMRAERGYEFDTSAIYYNLPGPWAAGTEDLLVRRVHELLQQSGPQPPLEPKDALQSISVPDGFTVQLVACEPQVVDPINLAFGHDGSLWVVEMGDYPMGVEGQAGGGRIKRLTDRDGDGFFETATTFLDGLEYPTGVHPWRDGVVVTAAPEIFLARDRDSDGRADDREVLCRGLALTNPQHRTNGFAYGLDHSLHCASGDNLGELAALRTGETVNASGHDLQIWPDSGRLAMLSGRTQFIRSRNDWGDWFGNDNSRPMYHYPIEDRYLKRNEAVRIPENKQQLFDPPVAPAVYPRSTTSDRFNDLFAANRFTSACSAIVVRSRALGEEFDGAALVCEPVHNLVHRARLEEVGATYRAVRTTPERNTEFLASTDPWFRPVRVANGPDGMIWVVDMYRAVIEHPEWIPEAWQQQIDVRAGSDRGRIYRVVPSSQAVPPTLPNVSDRTSAELAALLASDSGALCDMAQQDLLQRGDVSVVEELRTIAATNASPRARVHALWALNGLGRLHDDDLRRAIHDSHSGVVRNAIVLAEPRLASGSALIDDLAAIVDHPDAKVTLQLALTLGESRSPVAGQVLGVLAFKAANDEWLLRAVVSSSKHHSDVVLAQLLGSLKNGSSGPAVPSQQLKAIGDLAATGEAAGKHTTAVVARTLAEADVNAPWVLPLAVACASIPGQLDRFDPESRKAIQHIYERAVSLVADDEAAVSMRCQAVQMLGRSLGAVEEERMRLGALLGPSIPLDLQLAAIARLVSLHDPRSFEQLFDAWADLSYSVRDAAAMHMLSTAADRESLVSALESGAIQAGDLSPSVRQLLRQSDTQTMQARINRVLGSIPIANAEVIQQYRAYQQQAAERADIARGQALFAKHCAVCHIADKNGQSTGPNLANLTNRSPEALTESILAPNRAVEPNFRGYVVLTMDGRVLSGTIADEAGDTVTLSQADGKRVAIRRAEIEELRDSGMSLMPDGFHKELDPGMLRDLVEFMGSDSFARFSSEPAAGRQ